MEEDQTESLDLNLREYIPARRRKLLPWWIKTCICIFLMFGVFVPIGLIFGLIGFKFQISLYGIETYETLSAIGFSLIGLFLFKGITVYGLWSEKDWAIYLSQIDAIIGIITCVLLCLYSISSTTNMDLATKRKGNIINLLI
ncbi:MAG: hypothetical protein ACOYO1_07835 [Bacteroidales bacterium]